VPPSQAKTRIIRASAPLYLAILLSVLPKNHLYAQTAARYILKQVKQHHGGTPRPSSTSRSRVRAAKPAVRIMVETNLTGRKFIHRVVDHGVSALHTTGCGRPDAAGPARVKKRSFTTQRTASIPVLASTATHHSELRWPLLRHYRTLRALNHRSLRPFRNYRPIRTSLQTFCLEIHVDDVQRQDLLDFAPTV